MNTRTQIILQAVFWSPAGLVAGFFLFSPLISILHHYYNGVTENGLYLVNSDMGGQFALHAKHSLSWAALPLLALLTLWGSVRYKNRNWKIGTFYRVFVIALSGYASAAVLKTMRMGRLLSDHLPADVKETLSVESVMVYDWGLTGAVAGCLLYFLFTKKK